MQKYNSNSQYYSLEKLQTLLRNNSSFLSSYYSTLIEKTNELNETFHIYLTFDESKIKSKQQDSIKLLDEGRFQDKQLLGIPFNIKDSFLTREFPTTYGADDTNVVSEVDSEIVSLLESEGAILVGKTNIPAYANDVQTYNDVIGTTQNPWDLSKSAGGSTGGGAVSVLTGIIPFAVGSDFAGSIRIPAHFCGIKSYIPTNGNDFLRGHFPDTKADNKFNFYVGQVGFLSNFVDDFEAFYNILYKKRRKVNTFDIQTYSIIVSKNDEYVPVNKETQLCIENLAKLLKNLNIKVNVLFPKEFSFKEIGSIHVRAMKMTFSTASEIDNTEIEKLKADKDQFNENLNEFLKEKFWILPITSTSAIKHNKEHRPIAVDDKEVSYWRAMIHYTRPFNIANNPIITVPIGKDQDGLPIGVQIITERGNDLDLLAFGKLLESSLENTKL